MARGVSNIATFGELLDGFSRFGEQIALVDATDGRMLSYAELHTLAFDLAKRLPQNLPEGSRVILFDLNPLDWVPVFFAVVLRGWVVVPLDNRVSMDFLRSVEELTTPALIITGVNTNFVSNYRVLTIADIKKTSCISSIQLPVPDPNVPSEILFTSGTWARPKGVVLSQHNILTNAQQVLAVYAHKQSDTSLAVLPMSHAYQQTVGLILPLIVGSKIVFLTSLSSEALTKALRAYEVKTMLAVPRVLSLIESALLRKVRSHRLRKYLVKFIHMLRFLPRSFRRVILTPIHKKIGSHLQTLVVGGAPLSSELDHFFQGLGYRVFVGYGASECSPTISVSLNQRRLPGEVGHSLPGVDMQLNDKGEVLVRGDNVFLGYWPDVTRPQFFNTEDVAVLGNSGEFILKGRTKNLIIYPSGDKIFCEDIEYIANQIQGIEDSCVVGISSQAGIQLNCAIKGDLSLKGKEISIKETINKNLPFGVKLNQVILVARDDFPYTHTLKANRQRIQAMFTNAATSLPN